jgi:hypothetical protein
MIQKASPAVIKKPKCVGWILLEMVLALALEPIIQRQTAPPVIMNLNYVAWILQEMGFAEIVWFYGQSK